MIVAFSSVFFGGMIIHVLCQFCFCCFRTSLNILGISPLSDMIYKYFYPFDELPFYATDNILWHKKFFSFHEVQYVSFFFCDLFLWYHVQEIIFKLNVRNVLSHVFSSKSFIVLGLRCRSFLSLYIYVCTHIYIYMVLDKGPSSFFCVWLSSFPSAICCKDCFFPLNGL